MENLNNINLKEQFLKMYVKEATYEELQHINMLLEQENYKQVDTIIEEYTYNIINNKDLKNFDSGNPISCGRTIEPEVKDEREEKFSTEDMDPQAFELYCILMLINEYEKEQDKAKKELLHNEIQIAIKRYRNPEKEVPGRTK